MGTSGSYGGSNSQAWRDVRELWGDFTPDPATPNPPPSSPPGTPPPDPQPDGAAGLLGAALANALLGRRIPNTPANSVSLASIKPHRGAGGGGGGAGGGGGTSSSGGGGTGARRNTLTLAARGGAAIGAAQAYRDRDQAALSEFGVSLAELDAMTSRQRCAAILDAVLGEAAHPDEQAIRSAAIEEVKKILNDQAGTPNAIESIRSFIGNLAVQIGLVELRKSIQAGATSRTDAPRKERGLKQWVASKIRSIDLGQYGAVPTVRLHQVAFDMARNALRLMAAR